MYPSPPDFSTTGPDASTPPAWWSYTRDDGSVNVCETTGAAVVRRLRGALGLADGTAWDADVQAGLTSHAQVYQTAQPGSGWDALVAALQADASAQTVGALSLQFGLWTAYYQANGLRLDAIAIPGTAVLPPWGVPIPVGPAGDAFACFDPNRDPNPFGQQAAALSSAEDQSSAGVRLHSGESLPAPAPPVPPGPAGLSTPWLIAIGVAVVAVVAVVAYANRSYVVATSAAAPPARRTDTRRRRA